MPREMTIDVAEIVLHVDDDQGGGFQVNQFVEKSRTVTPLMMRIVPREVEADGL